jgi:cytochrome c553
MVLAGVWLVSLGTAQAQDEMARARKIVSGSCFICHGAEGESTSDLVPRLAGQHAAYIQRQLEHFKSGERRSTAMAAMAAPLTPSDMQALGRYFEAQSVTPEAPADASQAAAGRTLYFQGNPASGLPPCAECHGPQAQGTSTLPRLASQSAAYLQTQLQLFHARERTPGNALMHEVARKLSLQEMTALAQYLSSQ